MPAQVRLRANCMPRLESWFGPQGEPAKIDRAAPNTVTALVRIDRSGTAVLADALLDGNPVGR
jgi:uncharacterized membrane-anchored protein